MNESCFKAGIKEESKRIKLQWIKDKSPIHLWYSGPLKWICMDLINKLFCIHWSWFRVFVTDEWVKVEDESRDIPAPLWRHRAVRRLLEHVQMNTWILLFFKITVSPTEEETTLLNHTHVYQHRLNSASFLYRFITFTFSSTAGKSADTEKLYFELLLTFSSLVPLSAAHGEELHVKDWAYELLMAWIKSARTRRGACLFYLDVII